MKLGTGALYQPIQSYIVQAGFIHVICLGISNKSVAVPRQDSIRPYRAHTVLSGHCNIYIQLEHTELILQGCTAKAVSQQLTQFVEGNVNSCTVGATAWLRVNS